MFLVSLLFGLWGCSGEGADTSAPNDTDVFCDGAPVTNWDNFGQGFLIGACNACHAEAATNRHDAPENVVFDTEAQVAPLARAILAAATGDDPTMPPEGGVSDDSRYFLEVWLRCYPPES